MKPVEYSNHPPVWRQKRWGKIQLKWLKEDCIIRREKNLEDYILCNGIKKVYLLTDTVILDKFLVEHNIQLVEPSEAELIIITDQRICRLTPKVMVQKVRELLEQCPHMYFCLQQYYLNGNEEFVRPDLPEFYQHAILVWMKEQFPDYVILNRSNLIPDDGSYYTWVIPDCELLICKK